MGAFLLVTMLGLLMSVWGRKVSPGDPESHHLSPKPYHSINAPFDQSQLSSYWRFGGSTVVSNKYVRLTPDVSDRRGFIYNKVPIDNPSWVMLFCIHQEVQFKMKVFGHETLGGDGLAMCLLEAVNFPDDVEFDPIETSNLIQGPIFGLKSDFKGFCVAFDTFDNDNYRDNPSIYILSNPTGSRKTWDIEADFRNSRYTPSSLGQPPSNMISPASSACQAFYRMQSVPSTFIVRYQKKALSVYVRENEQTDYKLCVYLPFFPDSAFLKEPHLLFTAATGGVSDHHDIYEVVTRYLDEQDEIINNLAVKRAKQYGRMYEGGDDSTFVWIFLLVLCVIAVAAYYLDPRVRKLVYQIIKRDKQEIRGTHFGQGRNWS